jgi:hypothetical protein
MIWRQGIITALIVLVILFCVACTDDTPANVSVDGAIIETGLEVDEELRVINPQTTFKANQDFYFYFFNNAVFGSDRITVQLVDGTNDFVLAEHTYEVNPTENHLTDGIFFSSPGNYLITVRINGIVRATRTVTIE